MNPAVSESGLWNLVGVESRFAKLHSPLLATQSRSITGLLRYQHPATALRRQKLLWGQTMAEINLFLWWILWWEWDIVLKKIRPFLLRSHVCNLTVPCNPTHSDCIVLKCQANKGFYLAFDMSWKYICFDLKKLCSKGTRGINHVFGFTEQVNSIRKMFWQFCLSQQWLALIERPSLDFY